MASYVLLVPLVLSFLITFFLVPTWIRRAKNAGIAGKDVHKESDSLVAESGGVTVLVGFVLSVLVYVAIQTFYYNSTQNILEILALLSVVIMAAFIGFVDDILGWKIGLNKKSRLVLLIFVSIPLVAINAGKDLITLPFFGQINLGGLYPLLFIPIGIVGATATYNFLAGFNGLEAGQGILVLSAMALVAYFAGSSWLALVALCMVAALFAFLLFNFYPARVFPGDSLTYAVGSLIAVIAILGSFERVAVFFFIPYILEVILKARGRFVKQSFAKKMPDGSLDLQYSRLYSLNHVAIWCMKKLGIKLTEQKVVIFVWGFQLLIIILGFVIFRKGIFGVR